MLLATKGLLRNNLESTPKSPIWPNSALKFQKALILTKLIIVKNSKFLESIPNFNIKSNN